MYRRWIVGMSVCLCLTACNESAVGAKQPEVLMVKNEKKQGGMNTNGEIISDAIVTFSKGTSLSEAKEIIISHDMQVIKIYRTLSERMQKPMLHVRSSLKIDEMLTKLKNDSHILSVSPDYEREPAHP